MIESLDWAVGSYQLSYSVLLDDLSRLDSELSQEQQNLTQQLRRSTLMASLMARQVVPQAEEHESSYMEEALGTFLLTECRDWLPLYDQLQRRPERDAAYLWNCRRAAQVRI